MRPPIVIYEPPLIPRGRVPFAFATPKTISGRKKGRWARLEKAFAKHGLLRKP